jgi:hypothetical protein
LAPTQSLVDRIQRLQRYQRLQGRSVFNLCELSAIYVRGPGISRKLGKTALAARTASFPPGWRRSCDGLNGMTCIADTHSAIIRVMTVARASGISSHTGRSKGAPFFEGSTGGARPLFECYSRNIRSSCVPDGLMRPLIDYLPTVTGTERLENGRVDRNAKVTEKSQRETASKGTGVY